MNLGLWLDRMARAGGDRPALFSGLELVATYGEFHTQVAVVAFALQERGVKPGDRVAIFMKNQPEYLVALYGAWYAGAAVAPINAKLHVKEAAWIISDADASLVFASPDLAVDLAPLLSCPTVTPANTEFAEMIGGQVIDAPMERDPDDLAWLFYTSGTTGRPKGVRITHGMLSAMSLAYAVDVDQPSGDDAVIYAAPMSHAAGIYAPLHVLVGARHIHPESGGFDPAEILELSSKAGPVSMFMAPTMVRRFTDIAKALDDVGKGLRTIVYAGGPMYLADIVEAGDHFGPKFAQIYGQGECPMGITALSRGEVAEREHPRWKERLSSVGRAATVSEVRVADENGMTLPPDTVGEIMVKGPVVMPGYWNNEAATEKALKNGWLLTGDMGRMDVDGYLTLIDRSKDLIISGGSNIYPREVEEALLLHPDVHEASVIGRPSTEWGEDVVAFVVPAPGSSPDQAALDAHCLAEIARFKRPKEYVFVEELPKNNYGKVLKTELRFRLKPT
ncbi:MAG: class I adenylate-forming enzyme family protein [Pikeienuella sp.]